MPSHGCHVTRVIFFTAFTTVLVIVPGTQGIHSHLATTVLNKKRSRLQLLPHYIDEWNQDGEWGSPLAGPPDEVVIVWHNHSSSYMTRNNSNVSRMTNTSKKDLKEDQIVSITWTEARMNLSTKEGFSNGSKQVLGKETIMNNSKKEELVNTSWTGSLINTSGQELMNSSNKDLKEKILINNSRKEKLINISSKETWINHSQTQNLSREKTSSSSSKDVLTKEETFKFSNPKTHIISLDIYYGTMDYYSKKFIQSSLVPLWKDDEIQTRIKLNLYPYGRTEALNDTRWLELEHPENHFKCEHGTAECFKTALENCAIVHLNDPDLYVPFIACFVEKINMSRAMEIGFKENQEACFSSKVISDTTMDKIQECTESKEGLTLMSNAGNATNNLQNPSQAEREWANLPWVILNGHRSDEAELDGKAGAEGFLLKKICEAVAEPIPIVCVLDVTTKSDKLAGEAEEEPFIAEDEKVEWEETLKKMKRPARDKPFIAEDERPEREEPFEAKDDEAELDKPFVAEDEKIPEEPFVAEDEKIDND